MATSNDPREAPKANSATPRAIGDDTIPKSGNMSASPNPPESTTGLLLKRELRFAASGIATMEPAPKSRRTNPMVSSPRWQRVFAKGTKGAQQATPKPAATNASLVDSFARDRDKPSVMKISRSRSYRTRRNLRLPNDDFGAGIGKDRDSLLRCTELKDDMVKDCQCGHLKRRPSLNFVHSDKR